MPPVKRSADPAPDTTETTPEPAFPDVERDDEITENVEARPQSTKDQAARRAEQRAALQRELAELDAADTAAGTNEKPTHMLILANGDQVEVANGHLATHHDVGTKDEPKRVPVVMCFPLEAPPA